MADYFSDRELGPPPRVLDEMPDAAWRGLVGAFNTGIDTNLFAEAFPEQCADGRGISGTNWSNLTDSLVGHLPALGGVPRADDNRGTIIAMDVAEFAWRHASAPIPLGRHDYYGHEHLRFDKPLGRERWRDETNQILRRNAVAVELDSAGRATRLGPSSAQAALSRALPETTDGALDSLLETAIEKYRSPSADVRREALEQLWDALERVKTVLDRDKKRGVAALVQSVTSSSHGQSVLETEFLTLTRVGNEFRIRHHETNKVAVPAELVDYFFVRAYSLLDATARALGADSP